MIRVAVEARARQLLWLCLAKITTDFEINSLRRSLQHCYRSEAQYYPSFGEAQLSIGIGAAEKSGDQHARSEMEGLLNELS